MTTTLRTALENLIRNHGYDADKKTCRCTSTAKPATSEPITDRQHAAHVVDRIFRTLDGPAQ